MKKTILIFGIFIMFLLIGTKVEAAGNVALSTSKQSVQKGEEFNISINLSGAQVATLMAEIGIDTEKVEFISGPAQSNYSNGKIIYTWTDPNGGTSPLTGGVIATFRLRAKTSGTANFNISGEFYTPEEQDLEPSFSGISVNITEPVVTVEPPPATTTPTPEIQNPVIQNQTTSLNGNTYLRILRLDKEGISPSFSKTITQYGIIVGTDVTEISITAAPENDKAVVEIRGNKDLQMGLNKIQIIVTAENGAKREYIINVTKTDNIELANANLENLAIEGFLLEPGFNKNITEYNIKIGSNVISLNILAVQEKEEAVVEITGNENFIDGNNVINITVTAEDGITKKTYTINAYKKTVEEEKKEEELKKALEEIEKSKRQTETLNETNEQKLRKAILIVTLMASSLSAIWVAGYAVYLKKNKKI